MKSIELKCKLITPMFMAGAYGKTPELRSSEFKGMMRWWWRAMKAEDDIETLQKEEAEIFGGTGEGEGRSKVRLRLIYQNLQTGSNLKQDFNLDWRFDRTTDSLTGTDCGIGYILYSTVLPNRERLYFKPGEEFEIKISSIDENPLKKAVASLWLAIYLGGFGTRARRGGGNINVTKVEGNSLNLNFTPNVESYKDFGKWIINNFNKTKEIIDRKTSWAFSYSNLCFSRFIISKKSFDSWEAALNDIGKIYLDFRSKNRHYIFETAAFGLPVMHRSCQIEGTKNITRRSSPLIIKILSSNGKYWWMVLRLFGEFLQEDVVLLKKTKNKSEKFISQKPTYDLIEEFWSELKSNGEEFILNKPDVLNQMIEETKNKLKPKKIILFGSRARGDAHKNADIDIAIEADQSLEKLSIPGPLDLVDLNKASAELKKKIEKEGVVLYARKD